jgi:hypothetical protein
MGSRRSRKNATPINSANTLQSQLEVPLDVVRMLILQGLYISRLDFSLIASISAEAGSVDEAKKILDPLAEASVSEKEFQQILTYGSRRSESTISNRQDYIKMDTLSEYEAFQFLRNTFPNPSDTELRETIKAFGGDVGRAVDILLNTEYNNRIQKATQQNQPDSIVGDGDDEDDSSWAPRRPRRVARRHISGSVTPTDPAFPALRCIVSPQKSPVSSRSKSPVRSKWDALDSRIAFLSQCLSLPTTKVRSAFHVNAGSLPRTLRDLLKEIPPGRYDRDIVDNLKNSFKRVDEDSLRKIVLGTNHNLDGTMELARILDHDRDNTNSRITPRTKSPTPLVTTTNLTSPDSSPRIQDDGKGSYEDMSSLRSHYLAKRNEAFAAASESYQKSKSDSLRSGVSAYYASLGREYDTKYRYYSRLSANCLVAERQTRPNELDLHGVSVKDAVRLIEEGITAWWARVSVIRERGETKALESFVVIVGKGGRNLGGSKLGPAVRAWLRRNGWGFHEARGEIIVWGLRKNVKDGLGG